MVFKTYNDCCMHMDPEFIIPLKKEHLIEARKLIKSGHIELILSDNDGVGYKHSIDILANLKGLKILHLFQYRYPIKRLPPNLIELYTGNCFNQLIGTNGLILPNSIEKLVFGFSFNQPIDIYPPNLKILEFGSRFNQTVDNLPDGLIKLNLTGCFNQSLDNLPRTLKVLSLFGIYPSHFNQSVDNLPSDLEELYFSGEFNKSIDFLPSTLKIIYLSSFFNQKINNLPNGLIKLFFPKNGDFNESIDFLPDTIETLYLPNKYSQNIEKLPMNLRELYINGSKTIALLKKKFPILFQKGIVKIEKYTEIPDIFDEEIYKYLHLRSKV